MRALWSAHALRRITKDEVATWGDQLLVNHGEWTTLAWLLLLWSRYAASQAEVHRGVQAWSSLKAGTKLPCVRLEEAT